MFHILAETVPDIPAIPIFDFNNPWVALIQIALLFALPWATKKVVSLWATGIAKTAVLGVLSVVASGLTWLLDVAVAQAWDTADWTALVNVLVNGIITWAIGSRFFENVIAKQKNYVETAQTGLNLFENTAKKEVALTAAAEIVAAAKTGADQAKPAKGASTAASRKRNG